MATDAAGQPVTVLAGVLAALRPDAQLIVLSRGGIEILLDNLRRRLADQPLHNVVNLAVLV